MCKLRWLAFVHNSLFLCTYIFYVVGLTRNRALKQSAELLVLYCSSDWFIMSQSRMDVDPFYCLVHVLKLRFFTLVLVSYVAPESLSWFIYDTNIHNAGARAVPNSLRRFVFRDRELLRLARRRRRAAPGAGAGRGTSPRAPGGQAAGVAKGGLADPGSCARRRPRATKGGGRQGFRGRRPRAARSARAGRAGSELLCSC